MLSPRWRKLLRDVALTPGRVVLMLLAMAAGVCGLATMLSSYTILSRETTRNYLDTNPPSATLQLERIDAPLLAAIRAFPGIAQAQASGAVGVTLAGEGAGAPPTLPLTIFVVDDFNNLRINTVYREQGAWPPPDGSLLLERDALRLIGATIGQRLAVSSGHGAPQALLVSGTVHDPSLPPASRGQTVYAYATPATVAALGLDGGLRQLKLTVSEQPMNVDAIEATVARLAVWLRQNGHAVERIRIPPPGEHPHQKVMSSILAMLLVFSGVALVLSAVLAATVVGGMLQQQRRQIGVMKTIGARRSQIAGLYLTLVLALAGVATALGMSAGLAAGRAFSRVVLNQLLNFTMHSGAVPHWCYLLLVAAGVLLPLAAAALPIAQASAATVQAAISDSGSHGQRYSAPAAWLERLPLVDRSLLLALRNSLRRRGRLLLTLGLLALAGAMTMSSLNIRAASARHLVDAAAERHYDIETTLARPAPIAQVSGLLAALPQVALVEAWERSGVARQRADGLEIERVYPDGAHGTLALQAVPERNATLKLEMLAGRWLGAGQPDEVVLNCAALEFFPQARVGGSVGIAGHGRTLTLRVAGIARQDMTAATVFVSAPTYARMAGRPGQAASYRIVLRAHDEAAIAAAARQIGRTLAGAGIDVRMNLTETMLRKEVDGHFDLLIAAMLFIALLMAAVGLFGLGSAMGSNVAERGREFGVMRSIGASSAVVLRNVLCEGVLVALMSVPLALALSLPLSAAIGAYLGELLFGLAFPLTVSGAGVLAWTAMVLLGALLASGLPAWAASRLSIQLSLASL